MRLLTIASILTLLAVAGFSAFAAPGTAETSPALVCGQEGAFGIRFGDRVSSTQVPLRTFFFGRGCFQVTPPVAHSAFDTYAACVSEFDGQVFQIQALKVFDDQPPQGALSLTPAQRQANRRLGQQVLDELLARFPPAISGSARTNSAYRSWELAVAEGIVLEVSNQVEWAVTLECRHEALTQKVFRQRLHGNR